MVSIRKLEAAALANDGYIDKTEAKAIADAAKTPADKTSLRDMLARDAWVPGAKASVVAAAGKTKDAPASSLAGKSLGTYPVSGKAMENVVSRELGPVEGYPSKMQALGAARASGSEFTAVVQDKGTPPRWHAVETKMVPSKGFAGKQAAVGELSYPPAPNPALRKELAQKASDAMAGYVANPRTATKAQVEEAYVNLMAEDYGIPASSIKAIGNASDTGKPENAKYEYFFSVNVPGESGGEAVTMSRGSSKLLPLASGDHDDHSKPRPPPVIVMGPSVFASAEHAGAVLTHEATHAQDYRRGDELLKEWGATAQKGKIPPKDFTTWLGDQAKKGHITWTEQGTTVEQEKGGQGKQQTEVNASTNEFIAGFHKFDVLDTKYGLKMALKPLEDINIWKSVGKNQEAAIFKKLDTYYGTLDADHRKAFDDYLKAADAGTIMGRYAAHHGAN